MTYPVLLPGLTSTEKDRIPAFVRDLRASDVRAIALFPTVLTRGEREDLYADLVAIPGLRIPHVHLRSDCSADEMTYLVSTFGTEAFNIHPDASTHPFGPVPPEFADRVFIENVDVPITDDELDRVAGICPDYAHLENARLQGRDDYVDVTESQLERFTIGCCHISAIRIGDPNPWSGGWDHHHFVNLKDLDYLAAYARTLPARWMSLELENPFADQLRAIDHLCDLIGLRTRAATTRS